MLAIFIVSLAVNVDALNNAFALDSPSWLHVVRLLCRFSQDV
jgi:hypothetical protein